MLNHTSTSSHKIPTILIMAGGTGGHIFPGLAVAEKLKSEGWNIHWLGTAERMEADIIPAHGFNISFITISGVRNKNIMAWIKMPFKLISSVLQARKVINKIQPDVVLGMGGYASGPGGLATWLSNKPLIIHEQNASAGLTNRLLAKIATKVFCAFPNAFDKKIVAETVGNPLRASISGNESKYNKNITKVSNNILVVGGSLGAQILNEIVPITFAKLVKDNDNHEEKDNTKLPFKIWHQTGKDKQKSVDEAYRQLNVNAETITVTEFITDINKAYQWADIVICRAGALTVSELAMAAKPAIFIPLPHAVDDHQTKNAQYLVTYGAAVMINQKDLTSDILVKQLNELFSAPELLNNMAQFACGAANANATNKVAETCQQLAAA